MEDKHFQWLCRVLAADKAKINVLETLFFHAEAVDFWCMTDSSGCMKRRQSGEDSVSTYAEAISYFLGQQHMMGKHSSVLCSSCFKGMRTLLDTSQAEDFLSKRDRPIIRCTYLQEYRDLAFRSLFLYHTKYERGTGYTSLLYRCTSDTKERDTNVRLIHKLRDMFQIILHSVERMKTRRVVDLELEFLREEDGGLWLTSCVKCRVAVPEVCQSIDLLTNERKSETTRPTKTPFLTIRPAKPALSITRTMKPVKDGKGETGKGDTKKGEEKKCATAEGKYVFKRGQLRNKQSNLNSPLRIMSPESEGGEGSDSQIVETPTKPYSGSLRPSKSDRFHNSNFQELLMMNFLRKSGLSPNSAESKEDLQRYMESFLFSNESEFRRSQTMLGRGGRVLSMRAEEQQAKTEESEESDTTEHSEDPMEAAPIPAIDMERLPAILNGGGKLHKECKRKRLIKDLKSMSGTITTRSETILNKRKKKINGFMGTYGKDLRKWSKSEYLIPVLLQKPRKARLPLPL